MSIFVVYSESGDRLDEFDTCEDANHFARDNYGNPGTWYVERESERARTRYAVVETLSIDKVRAYLPSNYSAELIEIQTTGAVAVLISGRDNHGWTLDAYVIPRLASGLICARECASPRAAKAGCTL